MGSSLSPLASPRSGVWRWRAARLILQNHTPIPSSWSSDSRGLQRATRQINSHPTSVTTWGIASESPIRPSEISIPAVSTTRIAPVPTIMTSARARVGLMAHTRNPTAKATSSDARSHPVSPAPRRTTGTVRAIWRSATRTRPRRAADTDQAAADSAAGARRILRALGVEDLQRPYEHDPHSADGFSSSLSAAATSHRLHAGHALTWTSSRSRPTFSCSPSKAAEMASRAS